ncbi:hypothetical protein [Bernardetia sp. MNP-M8]
MTLNNLTAAYAHFIIHLFNSVLPLIQKELHIILGNPMPNYKLSW